MEKHEPSPPDSHSQHKDHTLHYLMLGSALAAGAVILSPYILPALGYGTEERAFEIMSNMQHAGISSGVAGKITGGLSAVPLIGATLAAGGPWALAVAGVVGIGGVLMGRHWEKQHDGEPGINWGKVIKYGALLTSALVALPSLLTGISIGITYMSYAFGDLKLAKAAGTFLSATLGCVGTGHTMTGLTGAFAVLPHLLTCGLPLAPAALSMFMDEEDTFSRQVKNESSAAAQKYSDGTINALMEVNAPLAANQPCVARLTLTNAHTGQPITPEELAVVHTEKLHLFVADSSLRDYHHIHPKPTGEPGVFACTFSPKTSHSYSAWADFTLLKDGRNHRLRTEMPSAAGRTITPTIRTNTIAESNDLVFDWKSSEPLRNDAPSIVEVNVRDTRGKPVEDLEPVMGAFAHLVGFSADGTSIIHTHPMGAEPTQPHERGGPRLRFHVEPDCSGATQFYLQVRRGGQDIYVPFGQQIQPPALAADKVFARHHSLAHSHAM